MKILITSGGTQEPIDRVRSITNHSTGRLGKLLAETFLKAGCQVTLVTTKAALKPEAHDHLTLLEISTVSNLLDCLPPLVKSHDVLIHSMAVSDYSPLYMTHFQELEETPHLADLLKKQNTESKISSQEDYQVLFLKKTPKVISMVKEWNPAIRLIGFKLLVAVSKEELIQVARRSLEANQADFIVANDLATIDPKQHLAYLVGPDSEEFLQTKQEIADKLVATILEKRD